MKKNTIALMIAASLMAGYMPVEVFATENNEIESFSSENKKYAHGVYNVSNSTLRVDSDAQSSARKYVTEESKITISEDGIKASLEFTEKNIMTNIRIKVNGEEVSYSQKETGNKSIEVEFNLNSLEDNIEVATVINLGFHVMDVSFRVLLDTANIDIAPDDNNGNIGDDEQDSENTPDDSTETPDNNPNNTPNDENKNENIENNKDNDKNNNENNTTPPNNDNSSNNKPNNNNNKPSSGNDIGQNSNTLGNGAGNTGANNNSSSIQAPTATQNTNTVIYKVQNEILSNSPIGYSAARAAVSSTSYIEVIDGVTYVTLGLSQLDVMTNVKVSVDGTNVNYETVRSNSSNNTKDIRFKVGSVNSKITLSAYITMSDMNISFGVDILENTMQQISKTEANKSLGTASTLAVTSTNSSKNNNTSSTSGNSSNNDSNSKSSTTGDKTSKSKTENNSELEEIEATEYFKKYTIENEVVSDSAVGKMMVKKYLNSTSTLEEIDGKYYLTLTFVGTSAMDNIKIMVNGKEVEYSMKNISDEDKGTSTFKFEIGSVNDEIKMSMLIVPINKTIEFGVSLLEDTMTLVEEGEVAKNEAEEDESAIQTLASLNTPSNDNGTSAFKTIIISTLTTMITTGILGGLAVIFLRNKKKNIKK